MIDPLLDAMNKKWGSPLPRVGRPNVQSNKPDRENPDGIYPEHFNVNDKRTHEQWRKDYLANETTTRNLIEKPMVQAVLKQIGHGLQTNFVDIARRESATLAARWEIPEKERVIEKDIADLIEKGLVAMIEELERMGREEVWE